MVQKLKDRTLAVSIAVDGSVDRFQVDNKNVKCKLVSRDCQEEDIFLGFDQADERKTAGYVGAVKKGGHCHGMSYFHVCVAQ